MSVTTKVNVNLGNSQIVSGPELELEKVRLAERLGADTIMDLSTGNLIKEIRGAILDSLRSLDWASRETRQKAKKIEVAISKASQRVHREPLEEEIAAS